jgi:signal peptidase II
VPRGLTRLIADYRWFFVVLIAAAAIDLSTKYLVFNALGVDRATVLRAVEFGMAEHGAVTDAAAGFRAADVVERTAALRGLAADASGVYVVRVWPGSPADFAGLGTHHLLLAVGDTQIRDTGDLTTALAEWRAGERGPVRIVVDRWGATETLTLDPSRGSPPAAEAIDSPPLILQLEEEARHEIIPGRLAFDVVLNPGAFGGLLGGQIGMLIGLSVVAVVVVAWVLLRSNLFRYQVIGGLIISGAVGNVYDRIVYGCVRDFIEFRWPEMQVSWMNPWNTFNFADSCIVVGIICLLIIELFYPLHTAKPATPNDEADAGAAVDTEGQPEPETGGAATS